MINELTKLMGSVKVHSENVREVLEPISKLTFTEPYEQFLATQTAFIERDITALREQEETIINIFDNRLAEYVFYLLHFPDFMELSSYSYDKLRPQIERIMTVSEKKSFYLSGRLETIEQRIKTDTTRKRTFWPYFAKHMYPYHQQWHADYGATIMETEGLSCKEIAEKIYSHL